MKEGETVESYVGRVTVILEEMRRLNRVKSKYEVNKKVLSSLKMPYTIVAPCLEENAEVMENMPLESLPEFFDICDDVAEEACVLMMKGMSLDSRPGKWCGLCKKRNHNEEDCYYNPRKGSSRRGKCFQCGERGHFARDCKRKNQEQVVKESLEEVEVEYLMLAEEALGNGTYDEDVWMIYPDGTTNHMTPYEKYFTALDRTHKAKIGLADGKFLRVEGRGDVKIMMKDGKKKMIKNVLFVPGLNRNVLSLNQMIERGYSAFTPPGKCTFLDRTGAVFGETVRDKRGPALRFQVIEGSLTS
ncbi:BnaAnng17590D [Brassica napus]|uniref:BnaAnng17590D protein n=1 Tax=Brassica napus TaxID=3708 RepID=A0A078J872_BRANA|nr:BnaAnng17590D [Brassica napus]